MPVTGHHGGIGLGFGAQVDADDVVAVRRVLGADATQHHVMGRGGCRLEQLDRTVAIHGEFSGRAAARSRAGRENDGVTSANRRRDLVDGRVLCCTLSCVTTDGGKHWWRAYLPGTPLAIVYSHVRRPGELVAFAEHGSDQFWVYVSSDGGRHWHYHKRWI